MNGLIKSPFGLKIIFFSLLLLGLISCASSGNHPSGPNQVGSLPKLLIKTANNGTLRAELNVYGPNGELVHSEDLQINADTGEVFSSQFELPRGFTFSFVITFYYTASGLPELPIAFVAKTASTDEEFLNVFWEESEVLINVAQLNPAISVSLSTSNLPNLDDDGDGFSNFSEIREGSDPTDPNSVPLPPQLEGSPQIISAEHFVEFTAVFSDVSGVASIEPVGDFQCGYFLFEVTSLDAEGFTKELHAKFNLYSQPDSKISDGGTLTLEVQATDALGISSIQPIVISNVIKDTVIPSPVAIGVDLNHPEILIQRPKDGELVSDFVDVSAEACFRDGVNSFKLQNIADFIDDAPELNQINGTLTTANLEKEQELRFVALGGGGSLTKSIFISVDNQNPIKVDTPTPGSTISNGFTLVSHVDKNLISDITQFYIEKVSSDPDGTFEIFELNQLKFDVNSLPEAFTGQVFDVSQVLENEFYVHLVAIGPNSGLKRRTAHYFLNIKPVIEFYDMLGEGPKACFYNNPFEVQWNISNLGSDFAIDIDGINIPTASGSTQGLGIQRPTCDGESTLHAVRYVQDIGTGSTIAIPADPKTLRVTTLAVNQVSQPSKRVFAGQIFYQPNDPLFTLNVVNDNGVGINSIPWGIDVWLAGTTTKVPVTLPADMSVFTGEDLGLAPWTEYDFQFHILNSNNAPIASSDIFTAMIGDNTLDNIVAWWGLDEGFQPFRDISINFHDAFVSSGSPTQLGSGCILAGCLSFDGNDGLAVSNSTLLDPSNGNLPADSFTIEAWVNWNGIIADNPVIVKQGQFLIYVLSGKLAFSVLDQSSALHTAGISVGSIGNPSNWHHIVGVYPSGGKPQLWVDGIKVNDVTTTIPANIQNSGGNLFFGRDPTPNFFNGSLDEVIFYNTSLNSVFIQNRFNAN